MRDLVQEGKSLYSAGGLHGAWPAHELLTRVEALDACRKSMPARRKKIWFLLLGSVLITIIFLILRAFLSHLGAVSNIAAVFCPMAVYAGVFMAIISIGMLIRLGRQKYNQDAAAVLGPLIRCIGPDIAKGSLVKVRASLKASTDSALFVRAGEKYAKGKHSECYDRFFKREILNLECRLRDGTRLLAGMIEHTVEKVSKKKNPRGKWKTKRKCPRKIGIKVRLLLDESRCRLTGTLKVPGGTTVRVCRHSRGALIFLSLRKDLPDGQPLDAAPLLALLSGAYGAVAMARQNEMDSPGGGQ
jgi:hypothetical protein